jgi:hypothetical protein
MCHIIRDLAAANRRELSKIDSGSRMSASKPEPAANALDTTPVESPAGHYGPRRYFTARDIAHALLLLVWLAVVVATLTRHEFWRDEVRALSLARSADSPLDLLRVLGHDGHPLLWYALLYLGNAITSSPWVLPVTSVLVACAAVVIFLLRAPFPLWFKALFIFNALPLYLYSVMARNYGISMLLLFCFAALYPVQRQHPLLIGVTLALLANTNAHSILFALLLTAIWLWDTVFDKEFRSCPRKRLPVFAAIALVLGGVALSVALVIAPPESSLTGAHRISAGDVATSVVAVTLRPADRYRELIPDVIGPVDQAVPYIAAAGLASSPPLALAAVCGVVGLGVFFDLVYRGSYRHQGLILVFLLTLYWLAFQQAQSPGASKHARVILWSGAGGALVPLLLLGVIHAQRMVRSDWRWEISTTHAVGAFLRESESLRDAIVVPEPDYLIEALPFYADNPIYFPREMRYGTAVSWTYRGVHLSLAELLDIARELKRSSGRPVLIAFGHFDLLHDETRQRPLAYGRNFTWTEEDLKSLEGATDMVAKFVAPIGDENFLLYLVR